MRRVLLKQITKDLGYYEIKKKWRSFSTDNGFILPSKTEYKPTVCYQQWTLQIKFATFRSVTQELKKPFFSVCEGTCPVNC